MGYLHISNLYKTQDVLLFKECYALEKVHGTSAHVSFNNGEVGFFSGGESRDRFVGLFDKAKLVEAFTALGHAKVIVYGEAYGGRQQGMSATYGKELCFIVFDVRVGGEDGPWLTVPDMASVATALGLEHVPFVRVSTALEALDAERDKPSEVAKRRGCGDDKQREGVVLRPLIELTKNNGERVIAKHRIEKFSERATPQKIMSPEKLAVLEGATAIAQEWVTPMRLSHVLDKMPVGTGVERMRDVISAMVEDVYREAKGEIVESRDAAAAIGKRTAALFQERLRSRLKDAAE